MAAGADAGGEDSGAGPISSLTATGTGTAPSGVAGRFVAVGVAGDGSTGRDGKAGVTPAAGGEAAGTTVAGTVSRNASDARLIREKTLTLRRTTSTATAATTNILHRPGRPLPWTGSGVVPASHSWKNARSWRWASRWARSSRSSGEPCPHSGHIHTGAAAGPDRTST